MLWACSGPATPPTDYSVTIDPSFANDEIDAVSAALSDWQTAVPELHLTYTIGTCTSPSAQQVCLHPEFAPPDPSNEIVGTTYRGASDSGTVLIYVDRIQKITQTMPDAMGLTRQTAAHELGHAMGLQHTAIGTLMAAEVPNQAQGVTAADVAQFWAVRGK